MGKASIWGEGSRHSLIVNIKQKLQQKLLRTRYHAGHHVDVSIHLPLCGSLLAQAYSPRPLLSLFFSRKTLALTLLSPGSHWEALLNHLVDAFPWVYSPYPLFWTSLCPESLTFSGTQLSFPSDFFSGWWWWYLLPSRELGVYNRKDFNFWFSATFPRLVPAPGTQKLFKVCAA